MEQVPDSRPLHVVAQLADLAVGSLRLVHAGGRRLCLVRTEAGVSALDNACPHEGYGLTQGYLADGLLTCAWHNWKFRADDGVCVQGEEAVQAHDVEVGPDGSIGVRLRADVGPEARAARLASLDRSITDAYTGQTAREVVRLLQLGEHPGELVWRAVAHGAPRGEFGWGHSIAAAADCLSMVGRYDGAERAFPIVTAIAGIAEESRGEEVQALPEPLAEVPPQPVARFRELIEHERLADAQALLRAAIHAGTPPEALIPWFAGPLADHHLSYGHGAIYVQKAFQLLEGIGWERADTVLPHLVTSLVTGTREDLLPYMRPFVRAHAEQERASAFAALAERAASSGAPGDPVVAERLRVALLDGHDRGDPLREAVELLRSGAGVDALLDVVVDVVSDRMLRYDSTGEDDLADDFNWLDITHGLTYAHAARWLHARTPGADTVRLALHTVFLAHWTGRHEWHTRVAPRIDVQLPSGDDKSVGAALQHEALLDAGSVFIVSAHAIKTAVAASEECARSGSRAPLRAAARFLREPHRQRFVAGAVRRSIDFVGGRAVRD